ncbi:unnamed protein product [Knipowitschia caucasica]
MDEDCDVSEEFDCPSLLCEEHEDLETRNCQPLDKKKDEVQLFNYNNSRKQTGDNEQSANSENNQEGPESQAAEVESAGGADKDNINHESTIQKVDDKETESSFEAEPNRGRKRRGKKQPERVRCKRKCKAVNNKESIKETVAQEPELLSGCPVEPSLEPSVGLTNSSELADPLYLSGGASGVYCPPIPISLLYSQPLVPIQPAPPALQATHHPYLHSVPQTNSQPLEMEITQVYSTRRSVRYSTRERGQPLGYTVMPGLENMDNCLLPPAPKKKTRTLYTTDQLEHLESLFEEDHYPDGEKRKAIAVSVGVTPQRIMVWFQNRRAKWRKAERSISAKTEQKESGTAPVRSPTHTHTNPPLPTVPLNKPPPFSVHFAPKHSQIAATASFPPLYSNVSSSPGQYRVGDGDQQQLSSQRGLVEYHPRPMHSPPPVRRASLPLYATAYATVNPPLLSTLAHTPPLFVDALEAGSSLTHHDTQPLQSDTSSLFDFGEKLDYLSSSQQSNLLYQLQTSYPSAQPLPRVSYLTPSPYLTPNPTDSNPTSYLTFGPGAGSTGVVTYSTGRHAFFQTQSTGQVLLQSTGPHGAITTYQSYPWGNMYSQPSLHQRPQCPPSYPSVVDASRDLQLPPTSSGPPSVLFREQRPSHSLTQTLQSSTALPPVSTLKPSRLRVETTPTKSAPLLPAQVSSTSTQSSPVPPCVKLEYDSPHEIHSHFHCDFSQIHF